MIYCLNRSETDPYFNLAAEEYLLREFGHDVFSVWRNEKSIIIGKHQNAAREIDHDLVRKENIPVIRRITGGGTVFHDPGNINFSFVSSGEKEKLVDFRKYTAPVISYLREQGINATFSPKNNIVVDGLKISGNSAHVFKNRVLHHGTLLFESDLVFLNRAIAGREQHYNDKSVRSIRSRVRNIKELDKREIDVMTFKDSLFEFILKMNPGNVTYKFSDIDRSRIEEIKNNRYLDDEWNFGYSPEYVFLNYFLLDDKNVFIRLRVRKGIIETSEISFEGMPKEANELLSKKIIGLRHKKENIEGIVSDITFAEYFSQDYLNQLVNNMF
jgi:lipoate-protein ligase A